MLFRSLNKLTHAERLLATYLIAIHWLFLASKTPIGSLLGVALCLSNNYLSQTSLQVYMLPSYGQWCVSESC